MKVSITIKKEKSQGKSNSFLFPTWKINQSSSIRARLALKKGIRRSDSSSPSLQGMSTRTFSQRHVLDRNSFSSSQREETVLSLLVLTIGLLPSIPSSISYGYRKINGIKS